MKLSLYNWLVEHEGETIAYNGFTGAMAVLDEENSQSIRELFKSSENIDEQLCVFPESIREALEYGGYVINCDRDERALLQISYNKNIFHYSEIRNGLTIVLTKRCNFRCVYCYEHKTLAEAGGITDEVVEKIVEVAQEATGDNFSITLYGGEPLIEYDKCLEICKGCKEVVEARGAKFSASMITNGYLLSPEKLNSLKASGLNSVQVTIDGSRETHNKSRPLADGSGTYDRILMNVKDCAGIVSTAVRMNASDPDKKDIDELQAFVDSLESVSMYVAPVDLSCRGDFEAYGKNKKAIINLITPEDVFLRSLSATTGGCAANGLKPCVVLPNGDLTRCWEHLEDCHTTSSLLDPAKTEDIDTMAKWVTWNPYSPSTECYDCRYLPACGGGCPRETVDFGRKKCLYLTDDEYILSIKGSLISLKKEKENSDAENNQKNERIS